MKINSLFSAFLFALLLGACQDSATNQGDQLYEAGKYQEAINFYSDYLKTRPEDEKTLFNRARAYEELGKYDESAADFKKLTDINPKSTTYFMASGIVNFKRKEYKKVLGDMQYLIKISPNKPEAHVLEGRAWLGIGEVDKAEAAYKTAMKYNSRYADAYLHLGIMQGLQGKKSAACKNLTQAEKLGAAGVASEIKRFCR